MKQKVYNSRPMTLGQRSIFVWTHKLVQPGRAVGRSHNINSGTCAITVNYKTSVVYLFDVSYVLNEPGSKGGGWKVGRQSYYTFWKCASCINMECRKWRRDALFTRQNAQLTSSITQLQHLHVVLKHQNLLMGHTNLQTPESDMLRYEG